MTPSFFIDAIKTRVIDGTAEITLKNLLVPPGRRPSDEHVAHSEWYNGLTAQERKIVASLVARVAKTAAFEFCCVIDGVAVIEPAGPKSEFRLACISPDGTETILNPPNGEMLHDILNAV